MILVVVDWYTKYAHFMALKHPFTASQVAKVFLDNVVKLHGIPKSIVSDKNFDKCILARSVQEMQYSIELSTAYHPQSDGQTERVNQCLEMYLRCSVSATPHKWASWLPLAEFWYNSSFHIALGATPFKALYGTDPHYVMAPDLVVTKSVEAANLVAERQLYSDWLQQQLARAQLRMKQYADTQRSPRTFTVGDKVYLKLQPYAQKSVSA